jgi:AraC-like DNA-binding protein/quercetin dioxygenase-like cupin family protein
MEVSDIHGIVDRTSERVVSEAACPTLSRHGVRFTGVGDLEPGCQIVRVQPDFAGVVACVGGVGRAVVNGEWRALEPGTAYVTPPRVFHSYHAHTDEPWSLAWVIYDETARDAPGVRLEEPCIVAIDARALAHAVDGLHRELDGVADFRLLEHWGAIVHMHAERALAPSTRDTRLVALWDDVREALGESWDLASLAHRAGLSIEHLRRLCHAEYGVSPLRYLTCLRMQHAARLLELPPYTVERVAELCGYENPFAFSTAFKRVMGYPPSQLRPRMLASK